MRRRVVEFEAEGAQTPVLVALGVYETDHLLLQPPAEVNARKTKSKIVLFLTSSLTIPWS